MKRDYIMKSSNLTKFENLISEMSLEEMNKAVSIFNSVREANKKAATRIAKIRFNIGSKVLVSGHEASGVYTIVDIRRTKCSIKHEETGKLYTCGLNQIVAV